MELEVSSPKAGGLLPSDCVSDPEEKEISDDDDDDRNHKHRRRDEQSQSLERDTMEQVSTRPYRKRYKPFENRHPFRENDYLENDLSAKSERRRPGLSIYSQAPLDLNQRIGVNQSSSTDIGHGRGRGREFGSWSHLDSRFSSVDIATQLAQQRSVPPSLFAGRGLPNVSHAQNASWNAFGLTSGIPNGGLDTLHPLGLQGTLRPPINASLNMGIPRQRCRDFEERGFCLRGDMCPMEHGVNRIVVEDVQSLSQFNLPVSLPSAPLLGTPGSLQSVGAPSSSSMNSKGLHSKISKPRTADNGLGLNGFTAYAGTGGADFYDPDQPLWTNDCPQPSSVLQSIPPKVDETEASLDVYQSDHNHAGLCDGSDNKRQTRSTATASGPQNTSLSVWGRISSSKNRSEITDKIDSTISSSNYVENEAREFQEPLTSPQGAARQGKRIMVEGSGSQAMDYSLKTQGDTAHNMRNPSQKALRTLFVNGIPQKNNRREALLSHFQKFGEVIDIYIPLNSERAFVQFSKREEAEAALKAPDAVMGNRFIKLWWANRDSVPDHGISGGNNVSVTPRAVKVTSVPYPSVANKERNGATEATAVHVVIPASDQPKPLVTNSPKALPPLPKKLESLELLKEELRKKQEMLDQKRNDFRRQLDKLEKQTTGPKAEVASEQPAKRSKVGTVADFSKAASLKSTNPSTVLASPQVEGKADIKKSGENIVHHHSNSKIALQEPSSLRQSIRPLAPAGAPFIMNRFKLDNRPTAFKIVPPLPTGFANVAVLREHFSIYGDLSTIELEDLDSNNSETKNGSAHISFTTRRSAEQAFVNGKCWQGHNLQFMWLTPNKSSNDNGSRENPPSASKGPSETSMQPVSEFTFTVSQEAVDPPSASKGPLDANMQPAEVVASTDSHEAADPTASMGPSDAHMHPAGEVSSIVSQEVAASGNGSSENMEGRDCGGLGGEHMEWEEDLQSSSSTMSSEKNSAKGNVC